MGEGTRSEGVEVWAGGCASRGWFYVHVETSVQQSILHPHNKSGRRFPLNQRTDGGGGGIKGWGGAIKDFKTPTTITFIAR